MDGKYADILALPHPVSQRHARMSRGDRAAQFAPFAALTGFDGVIQETARQTQAWIDLDEAEIAMLNETLTILQENLESQPKASFLCYQPDAQKAGGSYQTVTGRVKRLDEHRREVLLTDGQRIPIDLIFEITLE